MSEHQTITYRLTQTDCNSGFTSTRTFRTAGEARTVAEGAAEFAWLAFRLVRVVETAYISDAGRMVRSSTAETVQPCYDERVAP